MVSTFEICAEQRAIITQLIVGETWLRHVPGSGLDRTLLFHAPRLVLIMPLRLRFLWLLEARKGEGRRGLVLCSMKRWDESDR